MTYRTINIIATATALQCRLYGGAAEQGVADPVSWVWEHRFALAAQPGWAAAVESWQAAHPDREDGWQDDDGVITDGMILAAIQGLLA